MLRYERVGITVKSGLAGKNEAIIVAIKALEKIGAKIFVDALRCKELPSTCKFPVYERESDIDLLLIIGGDGTIFRAIRELSEFAIPILSINKGTVGFLTEINIEDVPDVLPRLIEGEGEIEERSILTVEVHRGSKKIFEGHAVNDAVISQGYIARLVDLKTSVNGELLTTFHADGLIISTPTGSTAYSLAAGGPIVHPKLQAVILTPINPHSFNQKPIVIPAEYQTNVEVLTKDNRFQDTEVILTLDGQVSHPLRRGDIVKTLIDEKTLKFLRKRRDTFFETIRTKLKWGERVD